MVKPKSFRAWNPEQTLLLLPSPVEWLPENHLVIFLLDLAAELDLEDIDAVYQQKDPRGEKAYEADDGRAAPVRLLRRVGQLEEDRDVHHHRTALTGLPSPRRPADAEPTAMGPAIPNRRLSAIPASRTCGYTDPDSQILKGSEGWIQGYNAQAAVDGDDQVIVAIGVSNQPRDAMPCVKPWWNRYLARSKEPEDWIGSDCEAWRRRTGSGR